MDRPQISTSVTSIPIMTMGYFGKTVPGEQVYTPPPSFNFEDLGLVLKITPKVHDSREVSLDVEAEFKLLGNTNFNGIPVISNRKFLNHVRLRFDESAIVAGLMNNTTATALSGLAGVVRIPGIGPLLGRTTKDHDQGELVLVIQPRLLSLPASETSSAADLHRRRVPAADTDVDQRVMMYATPRATSILSTCLCSANGCPILASG